MTRSDDDRDTEADSINHLQEAVRRAVPVQVAEMSLTLSVSTDAATYIAGEPISFTVDIRNRLPVPVEVSTADRRVWSWSVDGHEEAIDEHRYIEAVSNVIRLRPLETKRFENQWDGRLQITDDLDRWIPLTQGDHSLRAWLRTEVTDRIVADEVTFRVE